MRFPAPVRPKGHVRFGLATMLVLVFGTAVVTVPHLRLESSYPSDGSELRAWPEVVTFDFSEDVTSEGASATLTHAGRSWDLKTGLAAKSDELRFLLPVIEPSGSVQVDWVVLGEDGHPVAGTIRFSMVSESDVAESPISVDEVAAENEDQTGPENPANSRWQVFARFMSFGATLAVFGVVGFLLFVLPTGGEVQKELAASLRKLGLVSVGAQLGGVCLRLFAQTALLRGAFGEVSVFDVAGSTWGRLLLVQMMGGVLVGLAFLGSPRVRRGLAGSGALILALALPWIGHAASGGAIEKVVDSVHFASSGIWIGGVGVLLALLVPVRGWTRSHRRVVVLLPRFARTAMVFGPLTVLSGTLNTWFHAPAINLWFSQAYGQLLSLKIALVGVVLVLGGIHHVRLVPLANTKEAAPRLLRTGPLEFVFAVGVVLVTAFLVATAMD